MKSRGGFVSNSSSSSFIIIGVQVSPQDVTKKDAESGRIRIIGDWLNDGADFFVVTPDILSFAQKHEYLAQQTWVEVERMLESECELVDLPPIPLGYKVMSLEVDDHLSDSVETLIERYDE